MRCNGYVITDKGSKFYCPLMSNCKQTKLIGKDLGMNYSLESKSCEHFSRIDPDDNVFKKVVVTGKKRYVMLVDSKNIVVKCVPGNEFFENKDIMVIYKEYKGLATFEFVNDQDSDVMYEQDIKPLVDKHPMVQKLIDKFELTV